MRLAGRGSRFVPEIWDYAGQAARPPKRKMGSVGIILLLIPLRISANQPARSAAALQAGEDQLNSSLPLRDFLLEREGGRGAYFRPMNLYPLIADKVERDPGVVNTALATLSKWEELGMIPVSRMTAWRRILRDAKKGKGGTKRLLAVLRDDSESNRRLLDFAPFAGVLTREERRKVFLKCTYDH